MILFILSFIAGILTILAPCVLPLLPVIIGGSIDGATPAGNKKKAFTIALSLGISVIVFTFILKVSTAFITIPPEVWSYISGGIIIIFGLISLFPSIWESLPFVSRLSIGSNKLMSSGYVKNSFWGDVIIGASLGPVFSTCSPTYFVILATVLPQSFLLGFFDLLAYAIGLSGSLLLIAFLGQKLVNKLGGVSDTHGWFKRGLGLLFVLIGLAIIFGIDKKIETKIIGSRNFFDVTSVEQKLLKFNDKTKDITSEQNGAEKSPNESVYSSNETLTQDSNTKIPAKKTDTKVQMKITQSTGPKAPEFVNPSGFINTPNGAPISLAQFKGKVVLLDIWTYSCINCQRTIPYIVSWNAKYKDQGLVVIGLHTPEFAFEKVKKNVEDAVKRFGIEYPVVMDNDFGTWNAFGNQYWPRKYLINARGEIIYDHVGEGNYAETEKEIQKALTELNKKDESTTLSTPANVVTADNSKISSQETYFGSNRNYFLANGTQHKPGEQTLSFPKSIDNNKLYLDGTWNFNGEYTTNSGPAKIKFKYGAKNVYFVGASSKPITVTILKDGVKVKDLVISDNKLYTLIEGENYDDHELEIDIPDSGLEAYTFTFG